MPRRKLPRATPAKMGRPRVVIDWPTFDKLCAIQATLREIAAFFDCTDDTIENAVKREHGTTFSAYYSQKAGKGKVSLRRKQFELALAGDRTMLIWLGKQHLGQSDKASHEHAGPGGGAIPVSLAVRFVQPPKSERAA